MAVLVTTCPHCSAERMTFDLFGPRKFAPHWPTGREWAVPAAGECRGCGKPIALMLCWLGGPDWKELTQTAWHALQSEADVSSFGLAVQGQWPLSVGAVAPEHLPDPVRKAFLQAEGNFGRPGFEEAAALMYRRSLEVALKIAYPDLGDGLAKIIKRLVADRHLPEVMADWLTEVRLIGNDGAHELEGVDHQDLIAARGFVETALRYIFTLPTEIAARRGQPTAVA